MEGSREGWARALLKGGIALTLVKWLAQGAGSTSVALLWNRLTTPREQMPDPGPYVAATAQSEPVADKVQITFTRPV